MIFPKLFFIVMFFFNCHLCTLFHPMLLSCEGGAAKFFFVSCYCSECAAPAKAKKFIVNFVFFLFFLVCVCRASEEKERKKEKRVISASCTRFYFLVFFFLDTSVRTNIAAYGPRPTVLFFSTYFFYFSRSTMGGESCLCFFEKEGVVVEFCSSVACRGAIFEGEKTRKKRKQKRHNTIPMSEKNSYVLLSM